jgi:hypothetical protein
MTPMAANYNMVPAALLELPDKNAVIKVQAPTGYVSRAGTERRPALVRLRNACSSIAHCQMSKDISFIRRISGLVS